MSSFNDERNCYACFLSHKLTVVLGSTAAVLGTLRRRRVRVVDGSTLVTAILRVRVVVIRIIVRKSSLLIAIFDLGMLSIRHGWE